jgi:flagellar hook-basal body complex protein FliE
MSDAIMSQLLGVNDMTLESIRLGRRPEGLGQPQGESQFAAQLETLMGDQFSTKNVDKPGVMSPGFDPNSLRLSELYKSAMLTSLKEASEKGEITEEVNKESDLLNTSNTDEMLAVEENNNILDGETQLTASEIVFTTGNANSDLVEKMNAATTIEERLEYAVQLRDKIIEALKEGGHTATDIGKPDKISIDGEVYDVIRASRGMGKNGAVQFMEVGPASESDNLKEAIFSAGEKSQDLLTGLSSASSRSERNNMAVTFRNQVIDNLIEKGYDAKATDSADKIEVNGQIYDIIRGLNDPGSVALFQVLKV